MGSHTYLWEALDSIPLVLVMGKGGVGRSTLTANLALRAISQRSRVLHVAIDLPEDLTATSRLALRENTPSSHYSYLNLRGKECLSEYLSMKLPGASAVTALFGSSWLDIATRAAPGLQHLVVLGKLVYELQSGTWDKIVVDLPASGHALEYFTTVIGADTYFSNARVGSETKLMVEALRDRKRTAVVPVTIPEELPITETIEYIARLKELSLPLPFLVTNKCLSPPPADLQEVLSPLPEELRGQAERVLDRREAAVREQRRHIDKLVTLGVPSAHIGYATETRDGLRILKEVA